MIKKSIGIDIGRHHIRAVQIARTADGLRIEKTFGLQTRRSTDSPADVLRSLTLTHGFDHHAEVVVSLPAQNVFFAEVEVDGPALAKLRAGDATTIKDNFPVAGEDTIVQICSIRPTANGHRVVLAGASRQTIEQELGWLKEAKIRPTIIDTAVGAAHLAAATNHPEILKGTALLLCAEESMVTLAVTDEGQLVLVRNIPVAIGSGQSIDSSAQEWAGLLRSEIQITWRKLFGIEPDAELRLFLIAAPRMALPLAAALEEQMDCRLTSVNPYAGVVRPNEDSVGFNVCVAEGLALRTLAPDRNDRPDFCAAHSAHVKPGASLQKELALCACLCATIVVVWIVGLYVRLARLESHYEMTKAQIEQIFRQTVPEEKNVMNPTAQLKQKLDAVRAEYGMTDADSHGRARPLEVLYALGTHPPAEGELVLDDILITGDSVRISGSGKSFNALSQWRHTLEEIPGFQVVEAPNNNRKDNATGRVHFSLSLSCGKVVQ